MGLELNFGSREANHMDFVEQYACGDFQTPGSVIFTGWKEAEVLGKHVAQWIFRTSEKGTIAYVNIPGMENGRVGIGETLDIGTMRVDSDTPIEKLHFLIESGLDKLTQLNREDFEKLAKEVA